MLNFLFGRKAGVAAAVETQRETVTRALAEINAVLDQLPDVSVSVSTGSAQIAITLPEQMPDEALALPAPAPKAA